MTTTSALRRNRPRILARVLFLCLAGLLIVLVLRAPQPRAVGARAGAETGEHYPYTNELVHSSSPYLLEHAHNPVDWHQWSGEILEKARQEKKPIFLSIGYSACHWCHVMAREDFENVEIARILNSSFICIKVDREQRPDLDAQYVLAVEAMTGSAGWPLSVFLTPDRKPFYGGTYFPPAEFKQLLLKIVEVYKAHPAELQDEADRIESALARASNRSAGGALSAGSSSIGGATSANAALSVAAAQEAVAQLRARYDPQQGGFSTQPKFPEAPNLAFLMARYHATGNKDLLEMVTNTLDHLAAGGIYDQLGGGFHRYSTDSTWHIPHFEKMLYDQAELVPVYLDAYQVTHKLLYKRIAVETLGFVRREMRSPEGGFYSSIDADSESQEGKFYLWTPGEIQAALGSDSATFEKRFGVTAAADVDGGSVLHLAVSPEEQGALPANLQRMREKMLEARSRRTRPHTDEKILASWNGLMIAAFARGYAVLGDPEILTAASDAAHVILGRMSPAGQLMHSYYGGRAEVPGLLEDYSYVTYGLLALYEASHDRQWLDRAGELARQALDRFWDQEHGGFYTTAGQGDLLFRQKDSEDNALPSANGMAALALARLAPLEGMPLWRDRALQTVQSVGIGRAPGAYPTLITAYLLAGNGAPTPVVKVEAVPDRKSAAPGAALSISLKISVRQGWHINAHQASNNTLVSTMVRLQETGAAKLVGVDYPPGESLKLALSPEKLQVYQGSFSIHAKVRISPAAPTGDLPLRFLVSYQPCSDRACLIPAHQSVEALVRVVGK